MQWSAAHGLRFYDGLAKTSDRGFFWEDLQRKRCLPRKDLE